MALKLYNTLTKKKEVLKFLGSGKDKRLKLFVCGPTVYDYSHIGHARTYIAFDIIVKFLRSVGYDVFYLQNITDLDDKIIKRAQENGAKPLALARALTREYFKDIKALKVSAVTEYALATAYIPEIISQVERLAAKGYSYEIKGDGVYYDVTRFKRYGKLSGRTTQQAEDGVSRIDESVAKRNKADFCLWKFSKPNEPTWKSPFGSGRPGWHIEDTAITEKHFGPQYDIHGGARDLIFPHHEAEVAQMEAISGRRPFVRYWMHTGFLTTKGEKMSKSEGNFVTIRDFLAARPEDGARLLRFFVAKAHYRSPIDFMDDLMAQAKKELERIDEFLIKITKHKTQNTNKTQNTKRKPIPSLLKKAKREFQRAMEDDFNTSEAVAALFELIRKINPLLNADAIAKSDADALLKWLKEIDAVFGFLFSARKKQAAPKEIQELAKRREELRMRRKWEEADALRLLIESKGWILEDTADGPRVKQKP